MQKVVFILLMVTVACGAGLVLISLPVAEDVINLTFTMEDGLQGNLEISTPRFLRLGDKASLLLGVTLTPEIIASSGESVKIKASLQSTSLEVDPSTAVTAVISVQGTGKFRWAITGHTNEEQRATLWVFRQGSAGPELILARDLTFEVKTILGMRFRLFRWILAEIIMLCFLLTGVTIYRRRG